MVRTVLKIDGMVCSMCESHINQAIRGAFRVKKVSSSHAKGETEISSEEALDELALRRVIDGTGYRVLSVESRPVEKTGFSLFGKKR